ncbi:hypothetical protein [Nocardia terpenica]|uniref:hypothetical protein n=1 Tax=Nocardia terpenica TaxID=455432 RepID=UPI001EE9FC1A|nr:hypothetical protein [Nocardia terpenica]
MGENHTSPATKAATAAITRPIGFAVSAAFHNHCAAAATRDAAADASAATRARTVVAVWAVCSVVTPNPLARICNAGTPA